MRKIAFISLCLLVFAIGWENILHFPGIGTISFLMGVITFPVGVLAMLSSDTPPRRPDALDLFVMIFFGWGMVTYVWCIHPGYCEKRILIGLQIIAFMWLIGEYTRTVRASMFLYQAYVLGCFVSTIFIFMSFYSGTESVYLRYAPEGYNANDIGVTIALSLPPAWFLMLKSKKPTMRCFNLIYFPVGLLAIALTGSRAGFIVGLVGLGFVLLTLNENSLWGNVLIIIVGGMGLIGMIYIVPDSSLRRLGTIWEEISTGTLHGRFILWKAGLKVFGTHLLGVGTGGFKVAVGKYTHADVAHNTFLSVLVEQGVVGLVLFVTPFFILLKRSLSLDALARKFQLITLAGLILGICTLSWDVRKPMWLLLALSNAFTFYASTSHGSSKTGGQDQSIWSEKK